MRTTQRCARRLAFTLIELLVVVAIIALLIAILIPSLGKAREMAKRSACAANLKGIGQAFIIYANQWTDSTPIATLNDPSGWLHDESVGVPDLLLNFLPGTSNLSAHSVRRLLYCPSFADKNIDSSWDPNLAANPTWRSLGYALLNWRAGASGGVMTASEATLTGLVYTPQLNYQRKMTPTQGASTTVFGLDEIIAYTPNGTAGGNSLIGTNGSGNDFTGLGKGINGTNHLDKGIPAGANTLYMDGHVSWLGFSFATAVPVQMQNGHGYYYFPKP